jgi:hypothetical protein
VKIDTCFFTLFYLCKTEIQCLKFSIFRHIVCSPISESFSKFVKIGFWQLKKIQMLWIPNVIMNNDQVTHEKLTNTIYNLKQMIYMKMTILVWINNLNKIFSLKYSIYAWNNVVHPLKHWNVKFYGLNFQVYVIIYK